MMKIKLLITFILCITFSTVSLYGQNSITVFAWEDMNGDGLQTGEAGNGISGIPLGELRIYEDDGDFAFNAGLDTPYDYDSEVGGEYTFDNAGAGLPDGNYWVLYDLTLNTGNYYITQYQQGFDFNIDSDFDPATGATLVFIGLNGATMAIDVDLGLFLPGDIGDFVWEDSNGDGIQDAPEPGLDGVSMTLLNALTLAPVVNDVDMLPLTNPATSAGGGFYSFDNLPPGEYIVEFSVPAPSPDPWYPTQVTVNSDADDLTNDSDAENNSAAANYLQTHTIILLSDETDEEERIDAGFFQASIIGDWVWEDLNGDGIQDAGEPGINGVTVSLLDDMGAPAIGADGLVVPDQVTANVLGTDGIYQFDLVAPGDYQVQFNLPAPIGGVSWYPTEFDPSHTDADDPEIDSDANNDPTDVSNYLKSHVITIVSDEETNGNDNEDIRIDAGFWLPVIVGDKVFCDENGNGIDDDGVGGVDGVDVRLVDSGTGLTAQDADGVDLTTTTAGGGMYMFDLVPPGFYFVEFAFTGATPDPPFVFTLQNDPDGLGDDFSDSDADPNPGGTQGQTEEFEVISQDTEEEEKWDAGVYQQINIIGTIWIEDDGNSMLDAGEMGPGGVFLELFDAITDDKIDDAFTNSGDYEFIGLAPGEYYISFDITDTPLETATACEGFNDANDMVDNDDNGSDGVVVTTTTFTALSNCDPSTPPEILYIDFCYFFDCDEPNLLAATACDDIADPAIICDISILGTFCNLMPTGNSPGNQPNPLCPDGGGPHNMSWFAFVAYGGNYSITVTPTGCSGSTTGVDGVQIGLYTDCTFAEAVYCNPDCNLTPVTFDSAILEEGQTYYFFIDGCSGSVCSYEVEISGTPLEPNLLPDDVCIVDVTSGLPVCEDATYCPDATVDFIATDFDLTVDFSWTVTATAGGPYAGDPNPMTEEEILSISFPEEGVYRVCLTQVDNGCAAQQWNGEICREVTIEGIDDEEFTDQTICEEDLPFFDLGMFDPDDPNSDGTSGWQATGTTVDFGTVTGTVTTPEGCMYDQEFELMMHPESDQGEYVMTVCKDELPLMVDVIQVTELNFGGILTYEIAEYMLIDESDMNGCDSIIDINIELLDIQGGAFEDVTCIPEGIVMTFNYLDDGVSSTAEEFLTFEWFDANGDPLPDDFWNTTDPLDNVAPVGIGNGTYTLVITADKNDKICTFEYEIEINFEDFLPPNPNISGPGLDVCESDSIVTYTAVDFGDAFGFMWSYPSDASGTTSGALDEVLTINWAGSAGGEVTLITENGCGVSEEVLIDINVIPQQTPAFTLPTEVCIDSIATIEFMGDATNITAFMWDFDGATDNGGTGFVGPGPHSASWPDGGDKTITLTYEDNSGCLSTETIETISLVTPISPPVINCNPNTGEVSFTWDDNPNATGYDVEVTSISTITGMLHEGVLDGTTYTVSGLDDGETVTIILTIFTNDACQMITLQSPGCTSQDCIAPSIDLMSDVMTFCLDASSGTAVITPTVTSGESGIGIFSGPGIIDTLGGIFDPDSANIGMNTITYIFMTDDIVPCIGNQTIQIEVLETPVASFVSDVDTICILDEVNLSYDGTANVNTLNWDYGVGGTGTDGQTPTVTFDSPGEKTITLTVIKDGCESESITLDVFVEPELEPVVVNCSIQEIDQVEFSWNDVPGATGYSVSINGGAPFTTTGTSHGETGLSPDDVVTITVTVISDSRCPGSSFDWNCTAVSCPSFDLTFDSPIPDLCVDGTNPTITLEATSAGGDGLGSYTWSGPNVIGDQFDPNGLTEGMYEIFVIYEENSCQGDSSMVFNITTTPTSEFSVDNTTICVGETVNILFEGTQFPAQVLNWTSDGGAVLDGAVPGEYSATFNTPGVFDIQLDILNGVCPSTPTNASITVEPELVFDTINCMEELDQISFSWVAVDCASEYEVFVDGVSQGTQTNTDFMVTGLTEGQEVLIEVIAVSGCACGNEMAMRICEAKACTQVDLALSTMDGVTEFCIADDLSAVEIIAEAMGSDGSGTFTWSGPGVDQDGMFDPVTAGVGTHTIYYDFLEAPGCPYIDSITFTVNELPEVDQSFEEMLCYDQMTTLLEILPTGGDGDYSITLNGASADLMNDVEAGEYTIVVTDGNLCTATTSVTITTPAEPAPAISGATQLILGDSSNYSIQSNLFTGALVDSVVWTANGTVICNDPGCFSLANQAPTETTVYEVIVHYNGGCSVTATVTVEVNEPEPIPVFEIPNIISPNNDGENDEWQIVSNDESIVINSIRIFDRWGNMVYGFTGPVMAIDNAPIWNGKFGDQELQPGVYVYFVDYNDDRLSNRIRSGDITIIN